MPTLCTWIVRTSTLAAALFVLQLILTLGYLLPGTLLPDPIDQGQLMLEIIAVLIAYLMGWGAFICGVATWILALALRALRAKEPPGEDARAAARANRRRALAVASVVVIGAPSVHFGALYGLFLP